MKLSQCNLLILALGQKTSVSCTELGLSVPLTYIPFLHNSGSLLLCFTDVPSCDSLNFTQKFLKTNLKSNADLLLPSASRFLLNGHVALANSLTISDWLFFQQSLIILLCWQQIGAFHLLLFWNKLPKFLGDKLESFP